MIKQNFCKNWQFRKAEENQNWRTLTLPHDAMFEEKRSPDCASGSAGAYFPGGIYEYQKIFEVPETWANKSIVIEFEGVYQNAEIQLNGVNIGKIVYGYTEARFDLSAYIKYGEENHIHVKVDNQDQPNSRWYSGSGIYRPVNLYVLKKDGIALHGIKVRTLSYEPAKIAVTVTHTKGNVEVQILDGENVIASASGDNVELEIPEGKLWDVDAPNLYQCRARLLEDGNEIDCQKTEFGIRLLEWSPKGLLVNGKETLLQGGCLHHDNGILGACAYAESEERRVRIMKENGFNAIRSSHNPCSRAMLKACDKLGMYMIDETWDMWYQHKSKYDYAADFMTYYKDDINSMIQKDYNHPSVIFYSIGNEISEPAKEEGMDLAKEMIDYCHALDDGRAVTAGLNLMIVANAAKGKEMYHADGGINTEATEDLNGEDATQEMLDISQMDSTRFNMMTQAIGSSMNHSADGEEADKATSPILDALDIAGYNYASGRYPLEGTAHPNRLIYGSETFPQEIGQNWKMVKEYPYLIGDFMWIAFDYLGEAGIGAWSYDDDTLSFDKPYPWIIGGAGVIDLIGHPDGEAFYAKTVWGEENTVLMAVTPANHPGAEVYKSAWRGTNAIPSWSWKGCEGNPVSVEVYTKAPVVRLYLDDQLLSEKNTEEYKAIFEAIYQPGVLKAVGLGENGEKLGSNTLVSAKEDLEIRIQPEKQNAKVDDIVYIPIDICDQNGVIESNADELLRVQVEGGELLGFGSAKQKTEENYLAGEFTTYYGRSLAVVRVLDEYAKIIVSGKTLDKKECMI